jgi:hypothetical protein
MAIIAHGDYCDRHIYVTKVLNFTSNEEKISSFLRNIEYTNGGDLPECYEKVLHDARSLDWLPNNTHTLIMIGDDVPHEPRYPENVSRIDWRVELDALVSSGIQLYGVHAMPGARGHSKWFYEKIATASGGSYLTLGQFAATVDVIYAVCFGQQSTSDLREFRDEVKREGRMSRDMADVFTTLTGERVDVKRAANELELVPLGTFQILRVDTEVPIREFVEKRGLIFKRGEGFYEFTGRKKGSELVQEYKKVVLVEDGTGDMYTGDAARNMIGVPAGVRKRIKPTDIPGYTVFIQSTSYNRVLEASSRFLYRVSDTA